MYQNYFIRSGTTPQTDRLQTVSICAAQPYLLKLVTSSCVKKVIARPCSPARPARPTLAHS